MISSNLFSIDPFKVKHEIGKQTTVFYLILAVLGIIGCKVADKVVSTTLSRARVRISLKRICYVDDTIVVS